MVFVGIITDDKSKKYINKILKDNIDNVCFQIVYITEKSMYILALFRVYSLLKNVQYVTARM